MIQETEKQRLVRLADSYRKPYVLGVEKKQGELQARFVIQLCKGRILEMGIGNGIWLDYLTKEFDIIDVVDAVLDLLLEQKEIYGDKINLYHCLFEDFKASVKYDTINMAHILEHVADPVRILKLASEWLSEGGMINVLVPHADSLHRRLGVIMGMLEAVTSLNDLDITVGHRRVYTIEKLEDDIHRAGLKIINEQGLGIKLLSNSKMENWDDELNEGMFDLGFQAPIEFSSALLFQCTVRRI